ncbi:MAG: ABC transporter permease [Acidobacteriota bacterium]|nr:ABC transporter permease [Acidobacteriota bacterium]
MTSQESPSVSQPPARPLWRRALGPRLRAAGLALPLVAFVTVTFLGPMLSLLTKSFYDPEVADALPETMAALRDWDGQGTPSDEAFAAVAREFVAARQERTLGRTANRVNRVVSGMRSTIMGGSREMVDAAAAAEAAGVEMDGAFWRETMIGIDSRWGEPEHWRALQAAGQRLTARHYLKALDFERGPDGGYQRAPEVWRIYVPLFWRTFLVSLGVTLLCLVIGYPVAHMIANSPPKRANVLLLLVLLPFWTSLLVRTTSWIVLLQNQGIVNDFLVAIGLIGDDGRIAMIYNMTGTFVAMTHVLLPFLVLPLYSVMRAIPPAYMNAAVSLGATPFQALRRVYWPQTLPGVGAGCLLTFILAIGYYITPALVGGQSGQLISNMIAYHVQTSLNWGLAAALAALLLGGVTLLYVVYDRLVGIDRIGLG